jgi:hypothetical protein
MVTITYEQIALLLALAYLCGVLALPASTAVRGLVRAHRAARRAVQPTKKRKRRRRRIKTTGIY